jgi:predicted membrane-bound spermidine synthase
MTIATSLAVFSERVSCLYFWDLLGASIGSLLSLVFINWLGAPGGVLVCALLMLIAACFFATQVSKRLTFVLGSPTN